MKRHMEQFRRHLWLRRVCYGLMVLAAGAIFGFMGFHPDQGASSNRSFLSLPTSMTIPYYWQRETKLETLSSEMQIEDVISFGSEVLFLVRVPSSFGFPNKERLQCQFGSPSHSSSQTKVLAVDLQESLAAVVCGAPPVDVLWDTSSAVIKLDKDQEIRTGNGNPQYRAPLPWNSTKVVYEIFSTEKDVALFAHGLNQTLIAELPEPEELKQFKCVYANGFETAVTAQANEVFRCGHPPKSMLNAVAGKKMGLKFEGNNLPSVAYYNPQTFKSVEIQVPAKEGPSRKKSTPHHICACTMIYNVAKFLREWVYFHNHLGVEKFFFYDNNSEDNLDEILASLAGFNVAKHSWPWVKTQEAAFSHCSLLAKSECEWMLFTDVDEYFFPSERFLSENKTSILASFIEEVVTSKAKEDVKVGQIATYCNNYGPSGLRVSPSKGVTQGYTCRIKRHRRHKSIVKLSAIEESLGNQVHHFSLKPPYVNEKIRPGVAIINHYKFQVWDEFKTKFHRRAATYVADWTEERNYGSNDRVPGLGTKPVKPDDWESRYCEVQDYSLRDYTRRIFGSQGKAGKLHLAWE
ncbi:hypothetical protein KC19_4G132300 [Ceratodon purpureus]|uniref:Glycosyltransferase family 92 protein n=1 Tax=Ceratodon purpureus TaxID=3225 RepID=A0A8T0I8H7_CERPU|nr:hypothetical protein KC19_4G132300 [Ceratodon purpureus]